MASREEEILRRHLKPTTFSAYLFRSNVMYRLIKRIPVNSYITKEGRGESKAVLLLLSYLRTGTTGTGSQS